MFGTAQLCAVAHLSWRKALMVGVMPFLPGDALKAAALILVFARVRKRLLALSGGGAS
jgi:biotin transport system substrate-specific component